jgi:hypothetical protein
VPVYKCEVLSSNLSTTTTTKKRHLPMSPTETKRVEKDKKKKGKKCKKQTPKTK